MTFLEIEVMFFGTLGIMIKVYQVFMLPYYKQR